MTTEREVSLSRISVVGAGAMGSSIAQLFAQHGCDVVLIDPYPEALKRARASIRAQLEVQGLPADSILGKIAFAGSLEAAAQAEMVIEAVPEQLILKHELFAQLERLCAPSTILATNTSGLPINEIARILHHRERFLGTHFFTPAAIIPLVEVIRGDESADDVIQTTMDVLRQVGKRPVLIKKDIPGFIANRIQHALAREAMSLLEKGIASAEDIDEVVKWSLGVRLVFTGPLEQRDINGLDIHHAIAAYLYKDLENRMTPSALLGDKVAAGHLGMKSGQGFYIWNKDTLEAIKSEKNRDLLALIAWLQAHDVNKGD